MAVQFFPLKLLVLVILTISQALGPVNISAKSPEETSSPEDHKKLSLPGFDPFSSNHLTAGTSSQDSAEKNGGPLIASSLITEGVFPYQVAPFNFIAESPVKAGLVAPINAFVAAAVTMAVVSLKETGKVDYQSILFLLNSTDYYAGLLGSLTTAYSERKAALVFKKAFQSGAARMPESIKPILTAPATQALMNVVNGIAYTVAVSAGFEYFTQIWKYATRNIPDAKSVSGLINASPARRKQVILNLMYYTIIDANMRSRILSSVYKHRILTFEFIATNVAMYVGGQLGYLLAKKYGKDNPWATRFGPVAGSIGAGVLVQLLPDSWKSNMNQKMLRWKIEHEQKLLNSALIQVEDGVGKGVYTPENAVASLRADLDTVFRRRDMLVSFQLQQSVTGNSHQQLEEIRSTFKNVVDRLSALDERVSNERQLSLQQQMEIWLAEKPSPKELQGLAINFGRNSRSDVYGILLESAIERSKVQLEETEALLKFIKNAEHLSKIAPEYSVQAGN